MGKEEAKKRVFNYASVFILVAFNLMLAFFLVKVGRQLVENTNNSGVLKVSPEIIDQIEDRE